jgi:hypothetical protein
VSTSPKNIQVKDSDPSSDYEINQIALFTVNKKGPGRVTVGMKGSKMKEQWNDGHKEEVSQMTEHGTARA